MIIIEDYFRHIDINTSFLLSLSLIVSFDTFSFFPPYAIVCLTYLYKPSSHKQKLTLKSCVVSHLTLLFFFLERESRVLLLRFLLVKVVRSFCSFFLWFLEEILTEWEGEGFSYGGSRTRYGDK